MTKEELNERILKHFPNANYEIIEWDGYTTHPVTIKCKDCGVVKTFTRVHGIWSGKTRFCSTCSETVSQRKVKVILEENGFQFIRWANTQANDGKTIFRVEFKCLKCGTVNNRRIWEVIHEYQDCSQCGATHRVRKTDTIFRKEIEERYPGQFDLLEKYVSSHKKIKVKHNDCGFIFEVTPINLLSNKGCPRCNRYNSKGSKAIKNWLMQNSLQFETEKKFSWSNNKRYDFFVPEFNLLIEFNGEQHYKPIPFFLQSRSFEQQLESDRFKEQQAKKRGFNFLVIKYDEVDNIPKILSASTTIREE